MPLKDRYSFIQKIQTLPIQKGKRIPALAATAGIYCLALFTSHNTSAATGYDITLESAIITAVPSIRRAYIGTMAPCPLEELIDKNALAACQQLGLDHYDPESLEVEETENDIHFPYYFNQMGQNITNIYSEGGKLFSSGVLATLWSYIFFISVTHFNELEYWNTKIGIGAVSALMTGGEFHHFHQKLKSFKKYWNNKETPYLDEPNYRRHRTEEETAHANQYHAQLTVLNEKPPVRGLIFKHIICNYSPEGLAKLGREFPLANSLLISTLAQILPSKRNSFIEILSHTPEALQLSLLTISRFSELINSRTGLGHLSSLVRTTSLVENAEILAQALAPHPPEPPVDPFLVHPENIVQAEFEPDFKWEPNQIVHQLVLEKIKRIQTLAELKEIKKRFQKSGIPTRMAAFPEIKAEILQHSQRIVLQNLQTWTTSLEDPLLPTQNETTPIAILPKDRCTICWSDSPCAFGPGLCHCNAYCRDCAIHQLQATRNDIGVSRCSQILCKKEIVSEFFISANVGNPEELEQFNKHQLEWRIKERAKDWKYCRGQNCLNGKVKNISADSNSDQHFNCPACDSHLCLDCGKFHLHQNCDGTISPEIKILLTKGAQKRIDPTPHPMDPQFENGRFRPCPYCGKIIERIDGCNSVTCVECCHEFHWNRGKQVIVNHDFRNEEQSYILDPKILPHF